MRKNTGMYRGRKERKKGWWMKRKTLVSMGEGRKEREVDENRNRYGGRKKREEEG